MTKIKNRFSVFFKYATCLSALLGVTLSLLSATQDGYSHWSKRLLYFTAQSNIWIAVVFLLLFYSQKPWLYTLKYIFTVSITFTGIVFCCLLAPFSPNDYAPWTLCNLLTHVFTPTFALANFFLDEKQPQITTKQIFLSTIPPLFYLIEVSLLQRFQTDFGRGVAYPYFFMNYRSPVGWFGFSSQGPFILGTAYWWIIFLSLILLIAFILSALSKKKPSA